MPISVFFRGFSSCPYYRGVWNSETSTRRELRNTKDKMARTHVPREKIADERRGLCLNWSRRSPKFWTRWCVGAIRLLTDADSSPVMSVERLPSGAQGGMGRGEARDRDYPSHHPLFPPSSPSWRRLLGSGRFSTKCVIYLQEFFIYKYSTPQKLGTPLLLTVACPSWNGYRLWCPWMIPMCMWQRGSLMVTC